MSNFFPVVVVLAPFIAAIVTALPLSSPVDRRLHLGWALLIASFLSSLPPMWHAIGSADPIRVALFALPWSVLPLVELSVDRLAALMMVVISSIGMLLYRYSRRYLQQDPGLARFMTLLSLSIGTLLFMVASADLISLFAAWQLLSWFLCLLAHNLTHVPTAQSSFRTFIMLRFGDIAFLCGIALAFHLYGTVQISQLFALAAADQTIFAPFGTGLEISGPTAVTLLLMIGAMSKSAQFPLHMWLPDSLYAPTPIHALLHAGIINAGGFLLNRLAPLYALSPMTLHLVLLAGILTLVSGKCMMLASSDVKKSLGYSTLGQMGYMMMECGLGAFSLAVFHLVAHGLFKATVFLNCGDVIHKARLNPYSPPVPAPGPPNLFVWAAGFIVSLLMPLAMIIGIHYALGINFFTPQGVFIFLLFSWVTASHVTLTLCRLDAKWSGMTGALLLIALIATAYFFAAESFTHFLYPNAKDVAAYFQAAALPDGVFFVFAGSLVVSIVASWFMIYLHYHDRTAVRTGELWARVYVLILNRVYMDGIAMRLFDLLKSAGRVLDSSRVAFPVVALIALGFAWKRLPLLPADLPVALVPLVLAAVCLPLFPIHGLYTTVLTRAPRIISLALALLLPLLGIFLIPSISPQFLPAVGVLSAFGAIWGSLKALMQVRVLHLLSYAGMALYSILWWHLAHAGKLTSTGIMYAWAVTLVIGGLVLAWDRIRVRYGDLDLDHIGGLLKPMPRFTLCMGLLIMAAVGLPPFSPFYGYLGILLSPSSGVSFGFGLLAVIAAWFAASWYLFKLMQRLLFGAHREDLRYEDLRPMEIAAFAVVVLLLLVPVSIPQDWLQTVVAPQTSLIEDRS
jgi:NADH-quinone oxidoreductase subunit L